MVCPRCGSGNVNIQVIQENRWSVTKTKTKYKTGHGCLWWMLVGWWWWIIDLFIWIFAFIPRLIVAIIGGMRKKKIAESKSTSVTVNNIKNMKVCVCQNCGKQWNIL